KTSHQGVDEFETVAQEEQDAPAGKTSARQPRGDCTCPQVQLGKRSAAGLALAISEKDVSVRIRPLRCMLLEAIGQRQHRGWHPPTPRTKNIAVSETQNAEILSKRVMLSTQRELPLAYLTGAVTRRMSARNQQSTCGAFARAALATFPLRNSSS